MRENERQEYLWLVHSHQRYMLMAHLFARMLKQRGVDVGHLLAADNITIGEALLKFNKEIFDKKKEGDREDLY